MRLNKLLKMTSVGIVTFLFIFLTFDVASADDPSDELYFQIRAGQSTSFTVALDRTQESAKAKRMATYSNSRTDRGNCNGPFSVQFRTTDPRISSSGTRVTYNTSTEDYRSRPTVIRYYISGTAQYTFTADGGSNTRQGECGSSGEITIAINAPNLPRSISRSDAHLYGKYASNPQTSTGCTLFAKGGRRGGWGATSCIPNNELGDIEWVNSLPVCVSGKIPTERCRASGGWTPYE